jgi:hypothetical protein
MLVADSRLGNTAQLRRASIAQTLESPTAPLLSFYFGVRPKATILRSLALSDQLPRRHPGFSAGKRLN